MRVVPTCSAWLTVACLIAAQAGPVRAQDALEVARETGAETCPDGADLLARVRALHAVVDDAAAVDYVVAFAREREGAFTAAIRKRSSGAERVLHDRSESCAALAQATAVTLALLLDPTAQSEERAQPAQRVEPTPSAEPEQEEREHLGESEAISVESEPIGALTLALGAGGIAGVVRPVAPAFSAELGFDARDRRIALGALWVPPQTLDLAPGTIRAALWIGTVRACAAILPGALRLEACTGLHAGVLHGQARGYSRNEEADELVLAWPIEPRCRCGHHPWASSSRPPRSCRSFATSSRSTTWEWRTNRLRWG